MKHPILHDINTEILKSLSRFLAIAVIVALGAAVLYGTKSVAPAMEYTADHYFDRQHFADLRLVSPTGFTAADLEALQNQEYIREAAGTYSMDALIESKSGVKSVRLHALPSEAAGMDRPRLVDGRWPEHSGECLVDSKQAGVIGSLGSRIIISDRNSTETLNVFPSHEYVIAGFIESPVYINYANRGSISIGDGSIYCFIYLPGENFRLDYYTDLLVGIEGADKLSCYTDKYEDLVEASAVKLKEFAGPRIAVRYQEMLNETGSVLPEAAKGPANSGPAVEQEHGYQVSPDESRGMLAGDAEPEKPKWLVLSRRDNADYTSFSDAARRLDALASVFPVFFYLIAALVCLTTMTRMVEEQRMQMGIFRALGFSREAVAAKYLAYAAMASAAGGALGFLAGQYLLPHMIYRPFEFSYTIPPLMVPYSLSLFLTAVLTAVLLNTLVALWACYHEISSLPSELIRPRAPAPGHRVLLEKVPLIWDRLSFKAKLTVRNLFRYKKRLYITVLGITGCMAILLTGFGLRDSITETVPQQYYGLHSYHLFFNLISPGSSSDDSDLNKALPSLLEDWLYTAQIKVNVEGLAREMTTYLFVSDEPDKVSRFIRFRDRESRLPLPFPQPGKVVLTDKIADELGVRAGDKIVFGTDDNGAVKAEVGGVTENYIYHYIFITPEDYAALFGQPAQYNMVLGKVADGEAITEPREKELTTALMEQENVSSATTIASIRREFDTAMQDLNTVVAVLILCACLLNFVVLYNLTNINITERKRELATIRVLGFLHREVDAYLNREIFILMIIGILLGLAGGFFLHQFTVQNAEADVVQYVNNIKPVSYVWSVLITILFTIAANLATRFRLRRIKIVESLKSVE